MVGVGNLPAASSETAGILKLYKTTGNSEDGSMTQKSITEELGNKRTNRGNKSTIKQNRHFLYKNKMRRQLHNELYKRYRNKNRYRFR